MTALSRITRFAVSGMLSVLHPSSWHAAGSATVRGSWSSPCNLCLSDMSGDAETYRCDCGAVYHVGCTMFRAACPRCEKRIETLLETRYRTWLPKLPLFGTSDGESVVVSYRCPSCDSDVSASDAYCRGCGYHNATLSGFICTVCDCEVTQESGFCRHCGTFYREGTVALYQCPICFLVNEEGRPCTCGFTS